MHCDYCANFEAILLLMRLPIFRAVVFLTIYLTHFCAIDAQNTDTIAVSFEDIWIEKMSDKIAVDISLNNSYRIFEVKTPANKFILYPNTPNNLRVKMNYEFISFGFQFAPDFLPGNGDNDTKGNTRSFELGTEIISRHWFADISYSKIKGFYLKNTADYTTWVKGDPYFQFPDLQYSGFALRSGYYNNSRFSFRSLSSQTERQLKNAGSFIPVFNFTYYVIDNKYQGTGTQKTNNTEANIGPGYAFTFVAGKKYYLSLGLLTSFGYLNTRLTTRLTDGDLVSKQDNFIFRWEGKTGIGYNERRVYMGLYANVTGARYRQENTTAINFETRVFYHLFFGVRINSPDYLKKQVNKVKSKFP